MNCDIIDQLLEREKDVIYRKDYDDEIAAAERKKFWARADIARHAIDLAGAIFGKRGGYRKNRTVKKKNIIKRFTYKKIS